jgi:hypothetical protein
MRANWMHKGTLLCLPYHNAMLYHHALALLLIHVPTSTLHKDTG